MIVVIANYRTGSSTLIKKLHGETGLKFFSQYTGEWCHGFNGGYKKPDSDIKLYKIMPDNIGHNESLFKKEYLECADDLIFCLRKDIRAQVNSMMYSWAFDWWHPGKKLPDTRKTLTDYDNKVIIRTIINNLKLQKIWYKEFGGKIMFLEDREDKHEKYDKHDTPDLLDIPDYDLEIVDAEEYFNE
jgi:hypothetical protein